MDKNVDRSLVLAPAATIPALPTGAVVPSIIAAHGEQAAWRYLEFFAVTIRWTSPLSVEG